MKVKIGPYKNWFGPYQFADWFSWIGPKFVEWLGQTLPAGPFEWLDSLKQRKIEVHIDNYDTWSMDHTLSHIIHPMLVQLQYTKHGSPFVDDEDVPQELTREAAPPIENEWDTDDNFHKRWDYVIGEMIYAFRRKLDDDWESEYFKDRYQSEEMKAAYIAENARIQNGFRLFGKYYQNLWD